MPKREFTLRATNADLRNRELKGNAGVKERYMCNAYESMEKEAALDKQQQNAVRAAVQGRLSGGADGARGTMPYYAPRKKDGGKAQTALLQQVVTQRNVPHSTGSPLKSMLGRAVPLHNSTTQRRKTAMSEEEEEERFFARPPIVSPVTKISGGCSPPAVGQLPDPELMDHPLGGFDGEQEHSTDVIAVVSQMMVEQLLQPPAPLRVSKVPKRGDENRPLHEQIIVVPNDPNGQSQGRDFTQIPEWLHTSLEDAAAAADIAAILNSSRNPNPRPAPPADPLQQVIQDRLMENSAMYNTPLPQPGSPGLPSPTFSNTQTSPRAFQGPITTFRAPEAVGAEVRLNIPLPDRSPGAQRQSPIRTPASPVTPTKQQQQQMAPVRPLSPGSGPHFPPSPASDMRTTRIQEANRTTTITRSPASPRSPPHTQPWRYGVERS